MSGSVQSSFLVLQGVSKRFPGCVACDDINLAIGRGELFALLGPSGSGKSTLLALVAGLIPMDGGQIVLDGVSLGDLPPQRRDVHTVFQSYALFPHLSVYDNVSFGPRMRREPERSFKPRVDELLNLVAMTGLEHRYPAQLSGGQQQRVALARALANRPRALLLDEPLGALDLQLRKQMQRELKRLQRSLQTTFVLVTHDQEEAFCLADRVAVMNLGRIEQVGVPEEIYRRPRNRFVAEFIGDATLFAGVIEVDREGAPRLRAEGGELIGSPLLSNARGKAVLAIRPEFVHLESAARSPAHEWNSLAGVVEDLFFTGSGRTCIVRLPSGAAVAAAGSLGAEIPERGAAVFATWPVSATIVVESDPPEPGDSSPESGERERAGEADSRRATQRDAGR